MTRHFTSTATNHTNGHRRTQEHAAANDGQDELQQDEREERAPLLTEAEARGQTVQRLDRIEELLRRLLDEKTVRDWYSVEQLAERIGKAAFTVREWCRLGRLNASKRQSGGGSHGAWVISHDELLRYEREGLLPLRFLRGQDPWIAAAAAAAEQRQAKRQAKAAGEKTS
jgi:hypothetical protein